MAIEVNLPELGENIESGTVVSVLVKKGDSVEKDQPLVELETDKAVVEVPSSEAGTVSEIRVKEGDTLPVGGTILILDGSGGGGKSKKDEAPKEEKAPADEDEPAEEESEAKEAKDTPKDEDKPAPKSKGKSEKQVEVAGEDIDEAESEESSEDEEGEPEKSESSEEAPKREDHRKRSDSVRAAPSVRRLAREIGVDIYEVKPSSEGGLIRAEDVKAHAKKGGGRSEGGASPAAASAGERLPNFEKWGSVRREKMSTVRRVTAEAMTRSWAAPHVTHHDKADITELEKFRKTYGKHAEARGGKLTATAILVRIVAEGLKRFPQFNASLDLANSEIVYKEYCNIGVAVDTAHGLLVPNIKNADRKSFIEIAVELAEASARARERKSAIEELQGASITITNLGGIGGTSFTPIVNSPEVAIVGVSRAETEPVWIDGEFVPRMRMPISLSYDHRAIDGADAARYTRWLCGALEQPLLVFLGE